MPSDAMRVWREALDEYGRTSNQAAAVVIERAIAEAVEQTVEKIVAYLGRNRDDLERCLAAYDIDAGEWK